MIHGFVITKEGDTVSEEMANNCISSGKSHGFEIEKFFGIYDNIDNLFLENKLFVNPAGAKKVQTIGVKGCFLSHYFLWKQCIERNTSIAIFEYDALIINSVPDNVLDMFEDYLNLDYARHLHLKDLDVYRSKLIKSDNITIQRLQEDTHSDPSSFKYINRNHIKGAFGYILKPSGAQKLLNAAHHNGMLPADVLINLKYLKMFYTTPSIVQLNENMLSNLTTLSHTKRN